MFPVPVYTSDKSAVCGAVSLKMLLAYYGKRAELEDLCKDLNIRITGCTLGDIKRVAAERGLDPYCYDMDADELIRQDRPAIIWWQYNHWVVFCGLNDNGDVIINNPNKGQYHVSVGTFKTKFTKYTLWNGDPHDLPEA